MLDIFLNRKMFLLMWSDFFFSGLRSDRFYFSNFDISISKKSITLLLCVFLLYHSISKHNFFRMLEYVHQAQIHFQSVWVDTLMINRRYNLRRLYFFRKQELKRNIYGAALGEAV